MSNSQKPEDLLIVFDKIISDNPYVLRCSAIPLYEYYKGLLFTIGKNYCNFDEKLLIKYGLKTRWDFIKFKLQLIEDCSTWDKIINPLDNIKNEVGHNDKYIPDKNELIRIRDKSSDFKEWIIEIGKKYQEKSKSFSVKEKIYDNYFFTIRDGNILIKEFGNNPYIAFEYENLWDELKNIISKLYTPVMQFNKLEDIKESDLDNLFLITKIISRFQGREDMALHLNICPKCGGKIVETQREIGGRYDEPPTGIKTRIGCEKCNYLIDEDFISI